MASTHTQQYEETLTFSLTPTLRPSPIGAHSSWQQVNVAFTMCPCISLSSPIYGNKRGTLSHLNECRIAQPYSRNGNYNSDSHERSDSNCKLNFFRQDWKDRANWVSLIWEKRAPKNRLSMSIRPKRGTTQLSGSVPTYLPTSAV